MRKITFQSNLLGKPALLLFLTIIISSVSFGQKVTIEEPGWEGEIVYAPPGATEGVSLDRQVAGVKTKNSTGKKLTGIGKRKQNIVLPGRTSNTQIEPQDSTIYFVYRAENNKRNPKSMISIYSLVQKRDTRMILIGSVNSSGTVAQGGVASIKYKAKKFGESSYLIAVKNLRAGEYGFSMSSDDNQAYYMFTVKENGFTKRALMSTGLPYNTPYVEYFDVKKKKSFNPSWPIYVTQYKSKSNTDNDELFSSKIKENKLSISEQKPQKGYILEYYIGKIDRRGAPPEKCFQLRMFEVGGDVPVMEYSAKYKFMESFTKGTPLYIDAFLKSIQDN